MPGTSQVGEGGEEVRRNVHGRSPQPPCPTQVTAGEYNAAETGVQVVWWRRVGVGQAGSVRCV